MSSQQDKKYDIVVWGSTGFVGELVSEYLLKTYGANPKSFRWAIGGRSQEKLQKLKSRLADEITQDAKDLPTVVADNFDKEALHNMVAQTKVVITTVGPYAKYGTPLVEACADAGVHYVDLTGESLWVREIIDKYHAKAKETGAKIVPSCGFDSIPADLGCFMMADHLNKQHQRKAREIKYMFRDARGGVSGGTVASAIGMLEAMWKGGRPVRAKMGDPFLLRDNEDREVDPNAPSSVGLTYDGDYQGWTSPFIFANHDTKLVYRSNSLLGHYYGTNFSYREAQGHKGKFKGVLPALVTTALMNVAGVLFYLPPTRAIIKRLLPSPGQGPSRKTMDDGYFWVDYIARAETKDGEPEILAKGVIGSDEGDCGYKETSKMLAESALCLALDQDKLAYKEGGVLTTASAMGIALIERLRAKGMTLEVHDVKPGGKPSKGAGSGPPPLD